MIATDPRSEMLFEMGQCAYRLGMAFGREAERAETFGRRLELFQIFERCSFAVRMSVVLELRLRRAARAEAGAFETAHGRECERDAPERDRAELDPAEHDGCEADGEYERERDREPASLPVLLRTLGQVAADAEALPGPPPAELPTLRELLARVKADAAHTSTPEPSSGGGLRTRLATSASAPVFARPLNAAHSSGRRGGPALRRGTGPPR